jgi:membrane protein implicated in regulation of membrane protease activity
MEPWLAWIIAGFVLVIVELVTGTFYLLVIGIGAFAGAIAAWAGGGYIAQASASCVVALIGTAAVYRWHIARRKSSSPTENMLDVGQSVVLETWSDAAQGLARVRYRGTTWDARVSAEPKPDPGATLYITGQEGSTLLVAPR